MDGKGFKKLCQDCSLMDKKLDTTTVDLIFADNRVKPRGTNRIDFYQFEIALELVAEKKAVSKTDVRSAMIAQGTPKTVNATSTNPTLKARPKDNARLVSEKRIAAILRRSPRELGKNSWKKEIDNTDSGTKHWRTPFFFYFEWLASLASCLVFEKKQKTHSSQRHQGTLEGLRPGFKSRTHIKACLYQSSATDVSFRVFQNAHPSIESDAISRLKGASEWADGWPLWNERGANWRPFWQLERI